MTNPKCSLPANSTTKSTNPSWEEIHIPAPEPNPERRNERIEIVGNLPKWCHAAFPDPTDKDKTMHSLNPVQSAVFPTAFHKFEENMLICAPTGSGKTNIAVLSILNVMANYVRDDGTLNLKGFKIVYVAPMKALVQEVVRSFQLRLGDRYGMQVRELSGDVSLTKEQISQTQIIVTTPEKWDIITRKAGDQRANMQLVRLIIIDEIHLLHDTRGPVLEAIVARTLRQIETTQERIRLVALSATLPNYQDVATFLRVNPEAGLFKFDNSYRPCPLEQTFIGITDKKAVRRMNSMNDCCFQKVKENAGKNQILIFVHSRKETVKTAKAIRDMAMDQDMLPKFLASQGASREILATESNEMKTAELRDLLPYGFAVHHAGILL